MTELSSMQTLSQETIKGSANDTFAILSDDNAQPSYFLLSTPTPLSNELDCPFNDELTAWEALIRVRQEHPNGIAWDIEPSNKLKGAQVLYSALADIPVNEDGEIEVEFLHFDAGTTGTDIWHWFETYFDISISDLKGC